MSDALEQRLRALANRPAVSTYLRTLLREAAAELARLRESLAQLRVRNTSAERERDDFRRLWERGLTDLAACREALHRIAEEPVLGGTPVTFERLADYRRDIARAALGEAAATLIEPEVGGGHAHSVTNPRGSATSKKEPAASGSVSVEAATKEQA